MQIRAYRPIPDVSESFVLTTDYLRRLNSIYGGCRIVFIKLTVKRLSDKVTTVSELSEAADPVLEKLKSLKITLPILTAPITEGSLTDFLVGKSSSSSWSATINPKILMELFSTYREWQADKAQEITRRQDEIENQVELVYALAVKLLHRLNYAVSTMKASSQNLSEVHALHVEIGELKGRLTEVISNCNALCKRIAADEPESLQSSVKPLQSSIKPFAIASADAETSLSPSSTTQKVLDRNHPSTQS